MAFVAADVALLDEALKVGHAEIVYSNGQRVKYRTVEEIKAARAFILAEIEEDATTTGQPRVRRYRGTSRGH